MIDLAVSTGDPKIPTCETSSLRFSRVRPAVFLTICICIIGILGTLVHLSGFYALGADDVSKIFYSIGWANSPSFFPSSVWLPLEFYVTGTISSLIGNAYRASLAVNGFASVGNFLMVYFLAKYLFNERTAQVSAILLVFCPWHVWTSIAGQGEALYYFLFIAATYCLIRWLREVRKRWLVLGALSIFLLSALRHQGWLLAAPVSAYVAFLSLFVGRYRRQWPLVAVALAVMNLFPILYLGYNAHQFGDALHAFRNSEQYAGRDDIRSLSAWLLAGRYPFYIFLDAPLLAPFYFLGIRKLAKLNRYEATLYGFACYGYLAVIMAYGAVSKGMSYYAEQRYVLPALFAAFPLMASVITELRVSPRWRAVAVVVCCLWGLFSSFRTSSELSTEVVIAQHLRSLWDGGFLDGSAKVFVDRRDQSKKYYRIYPPAIALWCNHPNNVLGGKGGLSQEFETAMATSDDISRDFLEQNSISVILSNSPDVIDRLKNTWTYGGSLAGFKVFFDPARTSGELVVPPNTRPGKTIEVRSADGITLAGVTYVDPEFTYEMVAHWHIPTSVTEAHKARWEFIPLFDNGSRFTIETAIGNDVRPSKAGQEAISDRMKVEFEPGEDSWVGRYSVYLEILDRTGRPISLEGEHLVGQNQCDLGTVSLVSEKKRILYNFITGSCKDNVLAWRVIWSLIN